MFSGQRAGFRGHPSDALTRDWQAASAFANHQEHRMQIHRQPRGALWAELCACNRCISATGNDLIPRVL